MSAIGFLKVPELLGSRVPRFRANLTLELRNPEI
jgi:hypothetical protein